MENLSTRSLAVPWHTMLPCHTFHPTAHLQPVPTPNGSSPVVCVHSCSPPGVSRTKDIARDPFSKHFMCINSVIKTIVNKIRAKSQCNQKKRIETLINKATHSSSKDQQHLSQFCELTILQIDIYRWCFAIEA